MLNLREKKSGNKLYESDDEYFFWKFRMQIFLCKTDRVLAETQV